MSHRRSGRASNTPQVALAVAMNTTAQRPKMIPSSTLLALLNAASTASTYALMSEAAIAIENAWT